MHNYVLYGQLMGMLVMLKACAHWCTFQTNVLKNDLYTPNACKHDYYTDSYTDSGCLGLSEVHTGSWWQEPNKYMRFFYSTCKGTGDKR
jgi:hypothetical protein